MPTACDAPSSPLYPCLTTECVVHHLAGDRPGKDDTATIVRMEVAEQYTFVLSGHVFTHLESHHPVRTRKGKRHCPITDVVSGVGGMLNGREREEWGGWGRTEGWGGMRKDGEGWGGTGWEEEG